MKAKKSFYFEELRNSYFNHCYYCFQTFEMHFSATRRFLKEVRDTFQ